MRVYLVTEGDKNIGFGHIVRNLSLFEAFKEQGIIPTFILFGDNSIDVVLQNQPKLILNWFSDDSIQFFDTIKGSDIVIVDSYLAPLEIYNEIINLTHIPVFIDDIVRLNYPDAIIINSSIYAKTIAYNNSNKFPNFLGPGYCMLRKEFWDIPKLRRINNDINKILITFGGQDFRNLSLPILLLLQKKFPYVHKKIIISQLSNDYNKIIRIIDEKTEKFERCNAEEMINLMSDVDLCVCAGGQTSYELCAVGTPSIIISLAENQQINCETLDRLGIASFIGKWDTMNLLTNLENEIKRLRNKELRYKMIELGQKSINPDGSRLIVKELLKLLYS